MSGTVAIASGKGGVGKTWFSITLGHALARMRKKVLLVDGDVGLANVDVQLGLTKGVDLTMAALGGTPLSTAIRPAPELGFDVLPGRSGHGVPAGLDPLAVSWMQNALHEVGDLYDVLILDLPSGVEQGVRDLMRFADRSILLTTPEPTALADAYALLKATRGGWSNASAPEIVVNFADAADSGRETLNGLVRVCRRFLAIEPAGLGVIRRDATVPDAIGRQVPLLTCSPGSDAARDVIAIAQALLATEGRS